MVDIIPEKHRKGRGAVSNESGRFESERRVRVDDGWGADGYGGLGNSWQDTDELPTLRTTVMADTTKRIITTNDSPDIGFGQSINAYRGCEHGCIYCFARPTHAYLGFSPGLDFETRLVAKFDAPKLLEQELRNPRYKCEIIAMGTNTDPYQPIEREYKLTRGILEVMSTFNQPTGIVTKSALVARDIDILASMAERHLATVHLSLTTLDPQLARNMEPRAAAPYRRLATIKALSAAGIPTGVMTAPLIPGLNDAEVEDLLAAAWDAGARRAGYVLLRLPHEIKDLFAEWLEAYYPMKARHVQSLIKDTRGGRLNDPRWGSRMRGEGHYAELIKTRFELACRKIGFNKQRFPLDTTKFAPPPKEGDQLRLL
jgi:DNA repair photolyase